MVGQQVALPPRELLGWFTSPGDCGAIAHWLRLGAGLVNPTPRFGIALDMLCYGGLVASRTLGCDSATALERLAALRELRRRRPEAVVFAFSTITRLGKTVACAPDLQEHLLLREYCQLLDRVERLGERDARPALERTQRELDPAHLADYMSVRRRNHAVNRAAVGLVADGIIDYLVLAQEDAAPVGIHIPEQLALRGQIEEFRVSERVAITCGADEMTMMLLARHVAQSADIAPQLAVDFAAQTGADIVPAYESQPLRDSVQAHIEIVGGEVALPAESDAVLFVHTPIGSQPEVAQAPPQGQSPALAMQAESVVDRIESASLAGRLFGLADVAYCNGADPELIAALERRSAFARLGVLAAWNTAANTIGTVISQLCMMAAHPRSLEPAAVHRFLAARLVDDYGYQSCVRQKAVAYAEQLGADAFCLGPLHAALEAYVDRELQPLAHRYASQLLAESGGGEDCVRATLPWGRLFEIEIETGRPSSAEGSKNLA